MLTGSVPEFGPKNPPELNNDLALPGTAILTLELGDSMGLILLNP